MLSTIASSIRRRPSQSHSAATDSMATGGLMIATTLASAIAHPTGGPHSPVTAHAKSVGQEARLDLATARQPAAARYFSGVRKSRLLKDMREATSPEVAQTCEGMKKEAMAARAEKLVTGTRW